MTELEQHLLTIVFEYGPKMDWNGHGYRYLCSCGKIGNWTDTEKRAEQSGSDHKAAKMNRSQ